MGKTKKKTITVTKPTTKQEKKPEIPEWIPPDPQTVMPHLPKPLVLEAIPPVLEEVEEDVKQQQESTPVSVSDDEWWEMQSLYGW